MGLAVGRRKTKEDNGQAEEALEARADRDGSAASDVKRCYAECRLDGPGGRAGGGLFRLDELLNVVVEARHEDLSVAPLEPGHDLAQGVRRVLNDAPVAARVEIAVRPRDVDLAIHQAAQPDADGGQVSLEKRGVG